MYPWNESKTGDNDDDDNDDSVVELETCVKMNISPSPIAAQEVAAKPFVDPWPSLAVPPAWIIHLGRMNNFFDNGPDVDDDSIDAG